MIACFQILKVKRVKTLKNRVRTWVCSEAGGVSTLPFYVPLNQQEQSDEKAELQGGHKRSFSLRESPLTVTGPVCKVLLFSKDQTHRLPHRLIYLPKEFKP